LFRLKLKEEHVFKHGNYVQINEAQEFSFKVDKNVAFGLEKFDSHHLLIITSYTTREVSVY